jgi:phosphoserine phosphatase RsbU/P
MQEVFLLSLLCFSFLVRYPIPMQETTIAMRDQLLDRRKRLENAITDLGGAADLMRLLREVDAALRRLGTGVFGTCLVCHTGVGADMLADNPMAQYCLCDLTRDQQKALQHDLDLASEVQLALLPKQDIQFAGWEVHFRYLPAGPVSGDYCDVVTRDGDALYFLLGDVSGKGVAASLFMARLNALFRSLLETGAPIPEMMDRANRLLAESTVASHYATLVCGRSDASGQIELCNAGQCCPLVLHGDEVTYLDSQSMPLGIFGSESYPTRSLRLESGDTLFLFTDGLSEARDVHDREYGTDRVARILSENAGLDARKLAALVLSDVHAFAAGVPQHDDLTLMAVRRNGASEGHSR